jgi:predicted nucleic acid-binding protein
VDEPRGLEVIWRSLTQSSGSVFPDWTDAYLLAFAKARGFTLVSFDQAFKAVTEPATVILPLQ